MLNKMLVELIKQSWIEVRNDIEKRIPGLVSPIKLIVFDRTGRCRMNITKRKLKMSANQVNYMWTNDTMEERVERQKKMCKNINDFIKLILAHEVGHLYDWIKIGDEEYCREHIGEKEAEADIFAERIIFNFKEVSNVKL